MRETMEQDATEDASLWLGQVRDHELGDLGSHVIIEHPDLEGHCTPIRAQWKLEVTSHQGQTSLLLFHAKHVGSAWTFAAVIPMDAPVEELWELAEL